MSMELTPKQLAIIGKWQLDRSENFDSFMKGIGINALLRSLGNLAIGTIIRPVIEIDNEQTGAWKVVVKSTFKNGTWTFTPNEREKQKTLDGRLFWVTFYFDGDVIYEVQEVCDDDKNAIPCTVKRFVNDDDVLVCELNVGDVVAYQYFKRV